MGIPTQLELRRQAHTLGPQLLAQGKIQLEQPNDHQEDSINKTQQINQYWMQQGYTAGADGVYRNVAPTVNHQWHGSERAGEGNADSAAYDEAGLGPNSSLVWSKTLSAWVPAKQRSSNNHTIEITEEANGASIGISPLLSGMNTQASDTLPESLSDGGLQDNEYGGFAEDSNYTGSFSRDRQFLEEQLARDRGARPGSRYEVSSSSTWSKQRQHLEDQLRKSAAAHGRSLP